MPEHRVTGTASIDKGGGTTLEILGELARESSPDEITVLFGLEEDGTPLTIFDCQYTTSTSRFSGLESATLESQLLVGGAHLTTLNDIQFESVAIGYEHVDRWLGKSGIGVRSDYTKNRAEILFQCPPPTLFGIMSDVALEIEFDKSKAHSAEYDISTTMKCFFKGLERGFYKVPELKQLERKAA